MRNDKFVIRSPARLARTQRVTVGSGIARTPILLSVHALALDYQGAPIAHESWAHYVRRITEGIDRKQIAAAADINVSGVSRWLNEASRPRPDKVINLARGLNQSPIQALVAAGYLDASDVGGAVEIVRSPSELSDEEILEELRNRLIVAKQEQPWLGGLAGFGQESGVDRDENPRKGEDLIGR